MVGERGTLYAPAFAWDGPEHAVHDLAEWANGLAFKDIDFSPSGFPVIKIAEVKAGIGPETKRTKQSYDPAVRLSDGDMLFCWSGQPESSIGTYRWRGGPAWLNQHIFKVTPRPLVTFDYMFYLLRHLQPNFVEIARNKQTTGLGHVTKADLRDMRVRLPPRHQQQQIAEVLGALDEKIELNRRTAETLEATARALFESWFVNFDPVRAKVEGRATDLADGLDALFPNRLTKDSVPEGWANRSLSEIGRFLNGLALQKYEAEPDEPFLPVVKIAELRSGPTFKSGRASTNIPTDYVVEDGDHLFSWSGSLTHVRWSHGRGALNQHLFKVTPKGVPAWLLFYAVGQHLPEFQAIASGKAVTMGHIQRHHLDGALVAVPDQSLLEAMNEVMAPIFERSLGLALQSRALGSLRDALLPRLISGELRISDAESQVAAA